jgi:hypothetical protein
VRASTQRLNAAIESVLVPGERLATTGVGWAARVRPKVPVLFLARRQHWFALTDRRVLVFARHWGGPRADDLVLGKRYTSFTVEKVHRHRPLFQLRIRGPNEARMVFEFRPGHRGLASELVARLTRALPAAEPVSTNAAPAGGPAAAPAGGNPARDRDTAAAFWGDR